MTSTFCSPIQLCFTLSIFLLTVKANAQHDSILLIRDIEKAEIMLQRDFPKAMALCLDIDKRSAASPCAPCQQRSLFLLGKAFWINGEYPPAIDLFKQGIGFAQRSGELNPQANATNIIGLNFYYQGYYDSALTYFQESLKMYTALEDKAGIARVLSNISLMYHRKGDYQKTVEYLLRSEALNNKIPDGPRSIGDFPGMENIFPDSLYFREEILDNHKALTIHLKNGDTHGALRSYLNLGVGYNQLKEYRTAVRYYLKARVIQEAIGLRPYWNDIALNYRKVNMKDSCFYYHEKARQDFSSATRLSILYTYELLGDAHFHFEQYDSALHNYTLAMAMNVKSNNRITIAGLHRKMADANREQEKFDEAERHIHHGVLLAKDVSITHQRNLFKSAATLYSQKGDYKKALYFQTQYASLVDSLSKAETALTLTRLLAQYKTSKKERELADLKIEKEKDNLVLQNRNVTMLSLAAISLVSFAFIIVFVRQRNRIKKKNLALDLANKEQEALIREIHHRVKNNLQIISSLISLKAVKASRETSEVLYQLNGRIYSMGLIHERLYQKHQFERIALDTYLIELSKYILDSFQEKEKSIKLNVTCEPLQINVDLALTCGLILNELLTNSLKHAFINQENREVKLELKQSLGSSTLLVSDNGERSAGLPESFGKTFGLRFVDQLVKSKLKGDWSIECTSGFCVFIKFPLLSSER